MLNKKGTSLMELIISIALISVILVFIMRLLVDLNNMETNNDYAKNNQLIRAEILRAIENDLNTKTIIDIDDNGSSRSNLVVNFTFKEGSTSSISATENTLEYTNSKGELRRWTLEEGHIFTESAKVYFSPEVIGEEDLTNRIYTMLIDIEIHTTNDKNTTGNNNTLDDILLNYIGKQVDYNKNITCLGDACNNTYPDTKTLAQYIKDLYTTQGANNLYHHDGTILATSATSGTYYSIAVGDILDANDGSYRYAGSYEETNNWVCFGTDTEKCDDNHLYRIIGVFNNKVKLIYSDAAGEDILGFAPSYTTTPDSSYYKGKWGTVPRYPWSGSTNEYSRNNWPKSTLNTDVLNGTYLNVLGNQWTNKIATTEWKVGGNTGGNVALSNAATAYKSEFLTPEEDENGIKVYNAKVGLMYASDYGFAITTDNWSKRLFDYHCSLKNWMCLGTYELTITRYSGERKYAFGVGSYGSVDWYLTYGTPAIRPTFYLNSNVTYVSGTGTKTNPIRIN